MSALFSKTTKQKKTYLNEGKMAAYYLVSESHVRPSEMCLKYASPLDSLGASLDIIIYYYYLKSSEKTRYLLFYCLCIFI